MNKLPKSLVKHGMSKTPEYVAWSSLKIRCSPKSNLKHYKGIEVCERWRNSFLNFYTDMGPRPSDLHSVDRINGRLGYYPDNCRWATDIEQNRNTSLTIFNGRSTREICAEAGISIHVFYNRRKLGLSIDDCLNPELGNRVKKGEESNLSKLKDNQVREIRASTEKTSALMGKYGASKTTINNIRNNKTWKHIR